MTEQPKRPWFFHRWAWAITGGMNQNLLSAAAMGQTLKVALLLDSGAEIEFTDRGGVTALMFAAGGGHVDTVRYLLDRGANVRATRKDGGTALTMATTLKRTAVVDALTKAGG